jgi:hypothetical protein
VPCGVDGLPSVTGQLRYEEVTIFFLDRSDAVSQPVAVLWHTTRAAQQRCNEETAQVATGMHQREAEGRQTEVNVRIVNVGVLSAFVLVPPLPSEGQDRTGLSPSEVNKINELSETFAKAVLSGSRKSAAALYVDDAVLFYPLGETAVKGREARHV